MNQSHVTATLEPRAGSEAERYRRQLEVVCNNATVSLFIMDEHQQCVFMNPAAEKLTGFSLDELRGRPLHDAIHHTRPDGSHYPLSECPIDQALPQNNQEQGEEVFVHKDGHFYSVAYTASPIRENGRVVGTIIEVRDVSQEKATAQALRESEDALRRARIESALTAGEVGTWSWDIQADRVTADHNLGQLFGIEDEAPVARYLAAIHPEDRARVEAIIGDAIARGDSYEAEYRVQRPDGSVRWVHARGRLERDESGKALRLPGVALDVTARRIAQDEARVTAERLRAALNASGTGTFRWDMRTDELEFDANLHHLFGFPPGYTIGSLEECVQRIHPEDRGPFVALCQRCAREGVDFSLDYRVVWPDGSIHWLADRGKNYTDEEGQPLYMAGACVDITDSKRAEAVIAENERQFRRLAQAMPQIVWIADAEGHVTYFNERWTEYTGISLEEAIGTRWSTVLHPDDRESLFAKWAASLRTGEPFENEHRYRRHDGEYRWQLVRGVAVRDQEGRIVQWFGTATDIHDFKRAEEALRENEQMLRLVIAATPECVKVVSRTGALLQMNAAGIRMIEAESEEAVRGACVYDLISEEYREDWRHLHERVCSGECCSWQFRIVGLKGTPRWMETHAVPLTLPNGEAAQLAVTRDITERKRVEEEREHLLAAERAARSEAERISRMKDEFLATLSHELRTPLNAILGWANILRSGADDPQEVAEGLEVIERNARVQTRIIEDLLDMSRIISGKIRLDVQRIDLVAVLEAAMETVRPAAQAKEIRLLPVLDPLAGPVSGDPGRLQQVFWNLLTNAIKFTPKNGKVQVLLERVNSHLEISVIDSGQGIKPDFLPHVFDRFRQADASTTRRHGGLGLGLAIVKQLVEMHGGNVRAKSAGEGTGATFIVCLPLTAVHPEPEVERQHPQSPSSAEPFEANPSLEGLRILVVDDEPDARNLVKRVLSDCGAVVSTAASAAEAYDQITQAKPDILVSDIGMPGEDGYSLIRKVRKLPPASGHDLPAIALTAFARSEDRKRAILSGYQMHMAKPVEPSELIAMVASLAGRTGESEMA